MAKEGYLNVRITNELKKAAIKDAKKRGIKLSKYVETALIHELNNKSEDGTIHELKSIQKFINKRIEELEVQNKDGVTIYYNYISDTELEVTFNGSNYSSTYDEYYGGASNLIVFMLWIYLISYIFVLGMSINSIEEKSENIKNS